MEDETKLIIKYVHDIKFKEHREEALFELSKRRYCLQNIAPIIWHSVGTISALLQEIISVYPYLNASTMNQALSTRTCQVLALIQCVASHPETRLAFIKANIPLFLYPFLNTVSKGKAYEYLRLTSLGVIGALVKVDNPEFINFLLHTEIIPLSLRIMERGNELSQTVATFIFQKILTDSTGLNYICQTKQRFSTVITVMNLMVKNEKQVPSQRLFKHIAKCYQKLFDNEKAKDHLTEYIPAILGDESLELKFDDHTKEIIDKLKQEVIRNKEVLAGRQNQQRMRMMPNPTMDNKMNLGNGKASAEMAQPMYNHPGAPTYQSNGGQIYRGGHRSFVPNQASQPLIRPSSTNTGVHQMHPGMVPGMMTHGSPPVPHMNNQPAMMSYPPQMVVSPNPMLDPNNSNNPQMMRMGHNQSPYYHQMPQNQPPQYHNSGMASPGMNQPQPQSHNK